LPSLAPPRRSADLAPRRPMDDELPRTLRPVPADCMPIIDSRAVRPQAAMVRPAYRRWERERARAEHRARVGHDRLGLAVPLDVAARTNANHDTGEAAR